MKSGDASETSMGRCGPGPSSDLKMKSPRRRATDGGPCLALVSQKIDFRPPRQMPPAVARLRGDFIFRSEDGPGPHRPIDVSLASPTSSPCVTFRRCSCALCCLPKTQAFTGIAASTCELPAALLANWSRGGAARGASTSPSSWPRTCSCRATSISDASCRNWRSRSCFESALGKDRILEIYLNIIEWGPDLRGLRPAARRYFGREARELTPAEMAFLVANHPRADQVPEFIRARYAGAWAAFADRRAAGEAAVRGCDRRGGISASARRTHRPWPAAGRPDDPWRMETGREEIDKVPF